MQKRLLVLAAGILQVPVIKKAKDMGIYVIAADGDANAVGLQHADKAVVVNITSEEDVLRVAREERIDVQSPNQKIPDRKTKCVIKTHINIKQNVIFGAKLKPV